MNIKAVLRLLRGTYDEWTEVKAPQLGAALAYYTIFSIAPLLIIAIGVAGLLFGEEQARKRALDELGKVASPAAAEVVEGLLKHTGPAQGKVHTIVGTVVLVFGALGVFAQLQAALDAIWQVKARPGWGILLWLKDRLLSFVMVLGIGFLLAVALAINTGLSALTGFFPEWQLPGGTSAWQAVNGVVSFALVTFLFAMMYHVLPDVRIAWRDVWLGAAVTAVLFTVGKHLIGLYLGKASVSSPFGAAGSLVVLLVWVYYSAQVFLFGAVFTKVYAERYGSRPRPEGHAMPAAEGAG